MSYSFDNSKDKNSWGDSYSGSSQSFPDSFEQPQPSAFPPSSFPNNNAYNFRGQGTLNAPQQTLPNQGDQAAPQNQQPLRVRLVPYEDFIKNKAVAMMFFAKNPETKSLLAEEDVKKVNDLMTTLNRAITFSFMTTCTLTFAADHVLRSRNLIYGMTYRSSVAKFLFKFWAVPTLVTSLVTKGVLQGMYLPKVDQIAQRYNFHEDVFKIAYEKEGNAALREHEKGNK